MTLDEAIQELTRYTNEPYSKLHPYFTQATKLGLEVMNAYAQALKLGLPLRCELLPSETKE